MTTGGKIALIGGTLAAAAAASYYFLVFRKSNTIAQNTTQQITKAVEETKPMPSKYEGKAVRAFGTNAIFLVRNGLKMWLPTPDILNKYGLKFGDEILIQIQELDSIPTGASLSGMARPTINLLR